MNVFAFECEHVCAQHNNLLLEILHLIWFKLVRIFEMDIVEKSDELWKEREAFWWDKKATQIVI